MADQLFELPGAAATSYLRQAPTGIAAELSWALFQDDTTVIAETDAGIAELATVPGRYKRPYTTPDDQGNYQIVWYRNGTYLIDEDLVVTTDIPSDYQAPSDFNLTTLATVRDQLQKGATDTGQDEVIEQLIASASWAIIQRYGKFRPAEASATKKFTWDGGHRLNLWPYYLRSASSVVLDSNETTTTTLDSSDLDYELLPRSPMDDVYRWVRLPNHKVEVGLERELSITGDWGYADGQIPWDVQQACIITVVEWMRRGVQAFGTGFATEEDAGLAPAGLPMAAKRLLAPYDRHGQG